MNQVEQPHAVGPILERDLDDEAQVRPHQLVRGLAIAALEPSAGELELDLAIERLEPLDGVEVSVEPVVLGDQAGHVRSPFTRLTLCEKKSFRIG